MLNKNVIATLPSENRGKIGFRLMNADEHRKLTLNPNDVAIEHLNIGQQIVVDQRFLIVYVKWDEDNNVWRVVYDEQNIFSPGISRTMRFDKFMHVQDQKPSGTHGGTFTAGDWRTRDLNTVLVNTIDGASLNASTGVITLPAGKYWIEASANAIHVSSNKLRLNLSGVFHYGPNNREYVAYDYNITPVSAYAEIGEEVSFSLEHRCAETRANEGFGRAHSFGVPEVYSEVKIWEVS